MANFVVIIDPDTERRTCFIKEIKDGLSPVGGLVTDECSTGDFYAIWAANAQAPVSHVADDEGAAVIWGDAISEATPERIDAIQLRHLWEDPVHRSKAIFNGFYAGVVYNPDFGLVTGADLLGIFPVYYYANEYVLLVGSSPELFRYHPAFRSEFNPAGLVGILLTMHIFDGETLLRGVRRLAAGHFLLFRPGAGSEEIIQYKFPVSKRYFSLPFSAHVEILDQVIEEAITSHLPAGGKCSLMLSGGLDSRMLAGYLNQKGVTTKALTLGNRTDIEMQCAIPVAQALGFPHRAVDIAFDKYPFYANLQAKWEHVANGFNNIMNWGVYTHLRKLAPCVVLGHTMDAVVGTNCINWAYLPSSKAMSFEAFFANANGWGIRPEILKKLLCREVFGDLVEEKIARIRAVYESYSEFESQRAWCFNLYNRQRFHVGSTAWAFSFGAWPILLSLDRRVLESAGAMPAATIAERRAQIEVLCKRFPHLAALPLDRNSYNTEPLRPRLRHLLARHLFNRLRSLRRLDREVRNQKGERRYYVRIFDLNGPGWLAVRRQAEPFREKILHLFNSKVLEELLPGPDVPLNLRDEIIDASGLKSLLGIMIWSKDHL